MSLLALETAAVGAPITRGGVSLFPVYVAGAAPDVRIRDGAAGVVIAEADDATVPTITVTNTNPDPVVLVEGETVRGGNQDRTLNVTILVPAGTVVACPVSCVERGRWGGIGEFGRSRTYAPRRVRRAKSASVARNVDARGVKQSDQSLVWRMVDHELARLSVSDPASALRAADAAIERDDRAAAAVRDLVGRGPLPGQRGVVVAHGRRVVAAVGHRGAAVPAPVRRHPGPVRARGRPRHRVPRAQRPPGRPGPGVGRRPRARERLRVGGLR
jgi:hypothetical protein